MIKKEVKRLHFSRLSWPQKNMQVVYCSLLVDVFVKSDFFSGALIPLACRQAGPQKPLGK